MNGGSPWPMRVGFIEKVSSLPITVDFIFLYRICLIRFTVTDKNSVQNLNPIHDKRRADNS